MRVEHRTSLTCSLQYSLYFWTSCIIQHLGPEQGHESAGQMSLGPNVERKSRNLLLFMKLIVDAFATSALHYGLIFVHQTSGLACLAGLDVSLPPIGLPAPGTQFLKTDIVSSPIIY